MRCKRHVFILSLGWLLISSSAAAQVSTFDLSGTVTDASDAVLPGVVVTLQNVKTGLVRTATTDEKGRYNFFALPVVGEWQIAAELSGFTSEQRTGLVFQANSKPTIGFSMKVATLEESVTVQASAPIVETQKSELSLTVDQQKIETMPLNGRNYLDLALFSPGVNPAAQRGDLSVNGQLGRNVEYVIDGVSNKVIEWGDASKTGLSIDVIQEFQVISSQFSAEFGHALGGVVALSPRAGPMISMAPAITTSGRVVSTRTTSSPVSGRPSSRSSTARSCPGRSSRTACTSSAATSAPTRTSSWS